MTITLSLATEWNYWKPLWYSKIEYFKFEFETEYDLRGWGVFFILHFSSQPVCSELFRIIIIETRQWRRLKSIGTYLKCNITEHANVPAIFDSSSFNKWCVKNLHFFISVNEFTKSNFFLLTVLMKVISQHRLHFIAIHKH